MRSVVRVYIADDDAPMLDLVASTLRAEGEATTAGAMHASKVIVYGHFIAFDGRAWRFSVAAK
jgi:hypothetical protein